LSTQQRSLPTRTEGVSIVGDVPLPDPFGWLETADPDTDPWLRQETQFAKNYFTSCSQRRKLRRGLSTTKPPSSVPLLPCGTRRLMPILDSRSHWVVIEPDNNLDLESARSVGTLLPNPTDLLLSGGLARNLDGRLPRSLSQLSECLLASEDPSESVVKLLGTEVGWGPEHMEGSGADLVSWRARLAGGRISHLCGSANSLALTLMGPDGTGLHLTAAVSNDSTCGIQTATAWAAPSWYHPLPSPDGQNVLLVWQGPFSDSTGAPQMEGMVIKTDSGEPVLSIGQLGSMAALFLGSSTWLPDSSAIVCIITSQHDATPNLVIQHLDGRLATHPLPVSAAEFNNRFICLISTDGRSVAIIGQSPRGFRALWWRNLEDKDPWQDFDVDLDLAQSFVMLPTQLIACDRGKPGRDRLVSIPMNKNGIKPECTELVPARLGVKIGSVALCGDRLVIATSDSNGSYLECYTGQGAKLESINLITDFVQVHALIPLPDDELLINCANGANDDSFAQLHFCPSTGKFNRDATNGHGTKYCLRHITATGHDGVSVSADVVLNRYQAERFDVGEKLQLPIVISGYGYADHEETVSITSASSLRRVLLDAGAAFALTRLRPSYMGKQSEAEEAPDPLALTMARRNDFLALVDALIEAGIADPQRIAAIGHCAGGALIAGAIAARPELFRAAAMTGLTEPFWYTARCRPSSRGFGSLDTPQDVQAFFNASPSRTLKENGAYPAVLLGWATEDEKCPGWGLWRFAAALHHANASDNDRPLLLHRWEGGHEYVAAITGLITVGGTDVASFLFRELDLIA
jgi:Prolyl oligopeptidase family